MVLTHVQIWELVLIDVIYTRTRSKQNPIQHYVSVCVVVISATFIENINKLRRYITNILLI